MSCLIQLFWTILLLIAAALPLLLVGSRVSIAEAQLTMVTLLCVYYCLGQVTREGSKHGQ